MLAASLYMTIGLIPADLDNLQLDPDEGLTFIMEEGVRVLAPGFEPPSEPDCHVFRENGRAVYRIWWTTRRYPAQQQTGENRWSRHVSRSFDGLHFEYERGPEFPHGRFTNRTDCDLVRLRDGNWRAYTLIGGGNPWYCVDSYRGGPLADGWEHEPEIRINFGKPGEFDHTAARSPEAALLPDGRIRVYYIGWSGPTGPYGADAMSGHRWRILSAISSDGLSFQKEAGARIDVEPKADPPHAEVSMTKPLAVRLADGRWRMYLSAQTDRGARLLSAVTSDGLKWTREAGTRVFDPQGQPVDARFPSLVRTPQGTLRMYFDGPGGIRSAVATDNT